jgi:hypothetical protein
MTVEDALIALEIKLLDGTLDWRVAKGGGVKRR